MVNSRKVLKEPKITKYDPHARPFLLEKLIRKIFLDLGERDVLPALDNGVPTFLVRNCISIFQILLFVHPRGERMKEKDSPPILQFRETWEGNYGLERGPWTDVPMVDEREFPIE